MIKSNLDDLLKKASSPDTEIEQLQELINLGGEALCGLIALHPNCNKFLLDKLSKLDLNVVNRNLLTRYSKYPILYTLKVRELRVDDADYILKLRLNKSYSKYISKVNDDIEVQRKYIIKYLSDNAKERTSFYFILENSTTGKCCGTVRIYNFNEDVFEWGSWILDKNKSPSAAMETAILIYEFAFNVLGFDRSEFEVNKSNKKVVSYHIKSGAEIIREDEVNLYFLMRKEIGLQFTRASRNMLQEIC